MTNRTSFPFIKLQAGANDFILMEKDKIAPFHENLPEFARRCCRRRFSVGADGLLLMEASSKARVKMTLFNEDGSPAALSGNGVRCLAYYFLFFKGEKSPLAIETDAGIITAMEKEGEIQISVPPPATLRINHVLTIDDDEITGHYIDVGVPCFCLPSEDVDREDVVSLGKAIRSHPDFPEGVNVVFFSTTGPRHLKLRTYERGVDQETLSCGVGSLAAALTAAETAGIPAPVFCRNRSGETQTVLFKQVQGGFREVCLKGPVSCVYEGHLHIVTNDFL